MPLALHITLYLYIARDRTNLPLRTPHSHTTHPQCHSHNTLVYRQRSQFNTHITHVVDQMAIRALPHIVDDDDGDDGGDDDDDDEERKKIIVQEISLLSNR